jgi:cobalamin biosynthesis Mg chelatase CobN
MRRCILVLLALAAVASFGPGRADAATPCRDKIYNEWYHDGKVASTYPLSCYRDALKHVPVQDAVYTSLSDDIRLALQAAIARSHGQKVPSEVGGSPVSRVTSSSKTSSTSSTSSSSSSSSSSKPPTKTTKDTAPNSPDPGEMTTTAPVTTTPVVVASAPTSSSGGVPLPVLVLGGVALVLVASGAVGLGVRRYRRGHSA